MKQRREFIAVLIAGLCWLYNLFSSEPYLYTDNVGVAVVLNGYYTNPLSQYQHPLFCLLVYALSKIFPFADMYTSVVHMLIFCEIALLMIVLSGDALKKQIKNWHLSDILSFSVAVLVCVFLSAGLKLWQANYTVTAASFLFSGWITLVYARKQNNSKRWTVIGIFFICFGYMLRKEVGLLILPFVGLSFAAEIIANQQEKKPLQGVFRRYIPAISLLLLLIISQIAFNSFEPYASAQRYNDARTILVDYPTKTWNDKDDGFSEINKVDYIAATEWLLSETEIINTDTLSEMAEVSIKNDYEFSAEGFRGALKNMRRIAGRTDIYMTVMVALCFLLVLWNIVVQKSGWLKLISVSALIGAFIILLYFTFRGRAPLRVWQPTLIGVLLVEIGLLFIGKLRVDQTGQLGFLLVISVVLYFSAGQVIAHTEFHSPHTVLSSRVGADDSAYVQTFQDDDLYIWANWHVEVPKYFGEMGKLPTERVLEHNIALGDWTSGQSYYTKFLERIGHPNPIRDLVEQSNVYIMSDSDYILDFLRLHYGEDIELVASGTVNGKTAYRAVHAG